MQSTVDVDKWKDASMVDVAEWKDKKLQMYLEKQGGSIAMLEGVGVGENAFLFLCVILIKKFRTQQNTKQEKK